jgi:hypothetical protein
LALQISCHRFFERLPKLIQILPENTAARV